MTIWQPDLSGRSGSKFKQISDAIGESIASGHLPIGSRLPPQRELAYALGVSLNTITRAYGEATGHGFLTGEVGRGTYVRETGPTETQLPQANLTRPKNGPIDFSLNLPSPGHADQALAQTLSELSNSPNLASFLDYQFAGDQDHHLAAAAKWLGKVGLNAQADNIVLTTGAQHAIMVSLLATTRPGDVLLTDELTYAPIKAIAHHLGLKIAPVASDEHGLLCPQSLDAVCERTTGKVLYCLPTLHTPTTATMDADHRSAIAEIARKRNLTLIEDDVFGFLPPQRPLPLAEFAPERTIYITSVSKSLAPGLRVGYIHAPTDKVQAIRTSVSLSSWMPPPLMTEIATRWIEDGMAEKLNQFQRNQAALRQSMAKEIIPSSFLNADPHGFHVWLTMPDNLQCETFRMEAENRGVKVLAGQAFAVTPSNTPNAIRLSLSHECERTRVHQGLSILADIFERNGEPGSIVM